MVRGLDPWCVSQFYLLQKAQPAPFNEYRSSSAGGNRMGLEVNDTTSYSAEVNNEWSYTSTSLIRLHVVERDSVKFVCFNPLDFRHRSFTFNSNKSPTWCNNFSVYYPDIYLQLNMFRAFSRPSWGAQWLQWQPLVLPSYRGDSGAVFVVGLIYFNSYIQFVREI
jgi:hypothetical protein